MPNRDFLPPWWLRRRWPALSAILVTFLTALAVYSVFATFTVRYGLRSHLYLEGGRLELLILDADFVRSSNRLAAGTSLPGGWTCSCDVGIRSPWRGFQPPTLNRQRPIFGGVSSVTVVGHAFGMTIPLMWLVMLIAGCSAFGFWRLWKHRHVAGICSSCGYSLAGIVPPAQCPECGGVDKTRRVGRTPQNIL